MRAMAKDYSIFSQHSLTNGHLRKSLGELSVATNELLPIWRGAALFLTEASPPGLLRQACGTLKHDGFAVA